jgi:hypothetical protein
LDFSRGVGEKPNERGNGIGRGCAAGRGFGGRYSGWKA